MFGAGAGENVGAQYPRRQLRIVKLVEFDPGQHPISIFQANLAANGGGGASMVAGDHFHADAGAGAGRNGSNGLRPRWIDKPYQSLQNQPTFHIIKIQDVLFLRHSHRRQRQNTVALLCQCFRPSVPPVVIETGGGAVGSALRTTEPENGFRRAFDMHTGVVIMVVVKGRHEPVTGIEGNQVGTYPGGVSVLLIEAQLAGEGEECCFHGISVGLPCASSPVQRCIVAKGSHPGQYVQALRILTVSVTADLANGLVAETLHHKVGAGDTRRRHHHFIASEGARLVTADHRDRAQGLDRR